MSKNTVALRMLTYLKKEEAYIKDLRKFLDTQLFRLQIEELNLSAMQRNQLVRVQKKQQKDQSEAERVESQNLQIEELNLSATQRNQLVRVQKKQQKRQSEEERVESQNLQALSASFASPSSGLEPLSLDPDLPMDYEDEEEEDDF